MTNTSQLDELKQLFAQKIGLHIPHNAQGRFVGMLHERAALRGYVSLEEYRTFLVGNEDAGEWEEFARAFVSSETFFFRDHGQFDLLRFRLLPELITKHRHDKTLRLWSAGCASGEEAYSLAMLVDMLMPQRSDWNVLILGTDIDSRAIAKAEHGRYRQWSFRMVPAALQQRYFHMEANEWVLDERIRCMVTFRVANLVEDACLDVGPKPDSASELHDMDMILCRNVFIYFDPAAVSAVAKKLAATLVEGGYLMTAHTELIGSPVQGLESRLFAEGVVQQRHTALPFEHHHKVTTPPVAANAAVRIARPSTIQVLPSAKVRDKEPQVPLQAPNIAIELSASARTHADQGKYELAEQLCRKALAADPLMAAPYFLLAQLAQIKEDAEQAKEYLNKVIYLDHRCVAAYLELAALYERAEDMPRAQALRRAALGIVHTMPNDEKIEQYESTAGELAQWLAQWDQLANNHASPDINHVVNHVRSPQHGR